MKPSERIKQIAIEHCPNGNGRFYSEIYLEKTTSPWIEALLVFLDEKFDHLRPLVKNTLEDLE
ncbi:MAG TPA: hypothetical protein PLJ37_00700 [Chitinophagales bacterium]|nr:hypothetical protein [Chitinophagales bacterium]HMW93470.1 hypothetical protein [Chitinophagales bacterium]HMZ92907.1 hypothetical protein [Chitinophagales bacterium]HNG25904.1 hypothetical protein [Chitinophagales bacterium]